MHSLRVYKTIVSVRITRQLSNSVCNLTPLPVLGNCRSERFSSQHSFYSHTLYSPNSSLFSAGSDRRCSGVSVPPERPSPDSCCRCRCSPTWFCAAPRASAACTACSGRAASRDALGIRWRRCWRTGCWSWACSRRFCCGVLWGIRASSLCRTIAFRALLVHYRADLILERVPKIILG